MANLTSVVFTSGAQTSTGTVSTLDGAFQTANGPVGIKAASVLPTATDPALVVALRPDTVNANGQNTMANSAPVVIASGQSSGLVFAGTSNSGNLVSAFNLQSTELNALANTAVIVSSVGGTSGKYTNSNTGQARQGEIFLTLGAIGLALSAGACISGWFLQTPDSGTTYESTTVVPPRSADFIVPLPATTIGAASVYKALGPVQLPALQFKVLVQNNTGQALAATLNTILLAPTSTVL
jgi:hypothetical protein